MRTTHIIIHASSTANRRGPVARVVSEREGR